MLGVLETWPLRPAAWLLRVLIFPLGARFRPPDEIADASPATSSRTARHAAR